MELNEMNRMDERREKIRTIVIIAILLAIAAVSFFWISGIASSEDSFTGTYSSLDEKRTTVTELMGVTAGSSTALSLLPGDAGSPIADQLADLSGYFMFILAAIYLEKWMVTIIAYIVIVAGGTSDHGTQGNYRIIFTGIYHLLADQRDLKAAGHPGDVHIFFLYAMTDQPVHCAASEL